MHIIRCVCVCVCVCDYQYASMWWEEGSSEGTLVWEMIVEEELRAAGGHSFVIYTI